MISELDINGIVNSIEDPNNDMCSSEHGKFISSNGYIVPDFSILKKLLREISDEIYSYYSKDTYGSYKRGFASEDDWKRFTNKYHRHYKINSIVEKISLIIAIAIPAIIAVFFFIIDQQKNDIGILGVIIDIITGIIIFGALFGILFLMRKLLLKIIDNIFPDGGKELTESKRKRKNEIFQSVIKKYETYFDLFKTVNQNIIDKNYYPYFKADGKEYIPTFSIAKLDDCKNLDSLNDKIQNTTNTINYYTNEYINGIVKNCFTYNDIHSIKDLNTAIYKKYCEEAEIKRQEKMIEDVYKTGYDAGYSSGHSSGYNSGYNDGKNS